jgi:hypothetical protein
MISYKLAKELFDAGFERSLMPRSFQPFGKALSDEEYISCIRLTSLEELIEACGEHFEYLNRANAGEWYCNNIVNSDKLNARDAGFTYGSTPIQAVARLWLALYGKPRGIPTI